MIKINLAPERGRRRIPGVKFTLPAFNLGWAFGIVYLVALLAIGGYWWALISSKAALTTDIERAEQDLAMLKTQIGQESRMKDLATELRRRVEVIDGITQAQGRPIVLADAFGGFDDLAFRRNAGKPAYKLPALLIDALTKNPATNFRVRPDGTVLLDTRYFRLPEKAPADGAKGGA